jgi:hypothetical protein
MRPDLCTRGRRPDHRQWFAEEGIATHQRDALEACARERAFPIWGTRMRVARQRLGDGNLQSECVAIVEPDFVVEAYGGSSLPELRDAKAVLLTSAASHCDIVRRGVAAGIMVIALG